MSETSPITPRDLSWQQAQAGHAAQTVAQAAGAEPSDLRALRHSASPPLAEIRGTALHGFSLQVVLNLQLAQAVMGKDLLQGLTPVIGRLIQDSSAALTTADLELLSKLGFIFLFPAEAYDFLDEISSAVDDAERTALLRDFRRAAVQCCGGWNSDEIAILVRHLLTLGKPGVSAIPPTS
jgi:hypothetical protein